MARFCCHAKRPCGPTQIDLTASEDTETEAGPSAGEDTATEADSPATTQADASSTEAEEDESPQVSSRREAVERELRNAAGLALHEDLHPAPDCFKRLADAIAFRQRLVQEGHYCFEQVGVFARDVTQNGAKEWLVDTFPGFALAVSPQAIAETCLSESLAPRHFYEVILEEQRCWLYFDLEFSREANPGLDSAATMESFYALLKMFCSEKFGAVPDLTSVLDLESSTKEKFSKHIIVKRLLPGPNRTGTLIAPPRSFAFQTNAQAGIFVTMFLDYVSAHRKQEPTSMARALFVRHPSSAKEVSIIDASVYSRNRCFRVLFSSKFGKQRALLPGCGFAPGDSPAQQLLESLVSFVPAAVGLFRHRLIPQISARESLRAIRAPSVQGSNSSSSGGSCERALRFAGSNRLFRYLAEVWDGVRREHEKVAGSEASGVKQAVEIGSQFLAVTLARNRFCLCKGASHKSNSVYLVVDCARNVFYQKCHDVADCGHFRSREFSLAPGMLGEVLGQNHCSRLSSLGSEAGSCPAPDAPYFAAAPGTPPPLDRAGLADRKLLTLSPEALSPERPLGNDHHHSRRPARACERGSPSFKRCRALAPALQLLERTAAPPFNSPC